MVKFVVAYRKDQNNVGDVASNPLQYFLSPSEYKTVDIATLGREQYPSGTPIIVGGGGLLNNEFIGDTFEKIFSEADKLQLENLWKQKWQVCNVDNNELNQKFTEEFRQLVKKYIDLIPTKSTPRFLWGAGTNADVKPGKQSKQGISYPSGLVNFDLIGVRDWGTEHQWVPCASCMHPALRQNYAIKNDIIWFEHKKQLLRDFGHDSIPRFINSGANIEQTIELLGSANIILTNSYHGAYWGTLLKKRVVLVSAWSSKFYSMKHQPYMLDKGVDFKSILDQVPIHHTALDECINANTNFWNQIRGRV